MISTIIRCSDLVICMVRLVISGIRNSNLSDQFVTSVKCKGWSHCSKLYYFTNYMKFAYSDADPSDIGSK